MEYEDVIKQLTPEIYQSLKRSVELGRWPDGRPVTPEQRGNALQALIAWGERHLPPEQRIGYIDKGSKAGSDCDRPQPESEPLRWRDTTPGGQ